MASMGDYSELSGLSARVDNVLYMPSLDAPVHKPHPFVYFISVINESSQTIKITGRKWVVCEHGGDVDGELTVVEGEGVVGQHPLITPMDSFSYNSYHVIARRATVKGTLFGETSEGLRILVKIPDFTMEVPAAGTGKGGEDWV